MDVVSAQKRSSMMSKIRGRDTMPELLVRKAARRLGIRYRLNCRHLPGTPDLVIPKTRRVVFVHGCFWHSHAGCKFAYKPKSNEVFWTAKLQANVDRDTRVTIELEEKGWAVSVVWECETGDPNRLEQLLRNYVLDAH